MVTLLSIVFLVLLLDQLQNGEPMFSTFAHARPMIAICWAAALLVLVTPSGHAVAQTAGPSFNDTAIKNCRSANSQLRLAACTDIINAKGFGKPSALSEALDGRCWAYHSMQMYERAIADCNMAIQLRPDYAFAYNNLGAALVGLNKHREAIREFNTAIQLRSNFVTALNNRGNAFLALGDKLAATRDFTTVLTIKPADIAAREGLSRASSPIEAKQLVQQPKAPEPARQNNTFEWSTISISADAKATSKGRALLIAIDDYDNIPKLVGPKNDVDAASSVLRQIGFEVEILRNPKRDEILEAIGRSNSTAQRGSAFVFYYSGHAAEIGGTNNLLLTNFSESSPDLASQTLSLQSVLDQLANLNYEKLLVAFDACRNVVDIAQSPISKNNAGGSTRGYRGLSVAQGELKEISRREYAVLFSTSLGELAIDSLDGGLSPFTRSFVTALQEESSFVQAMLLTKRMTEESTNKRQSPTLEIKWNGDLQYARGTSSRSQSTYELNEKLRHIARADQRSELDKITRSIRTNSDTISTLSLDDRVMDSCNYGRGLLWSSSFLSVKYCALQVLGIPNGKSEASGQPIYSYGEYLGATWNIDLDFDGKPEKIDASLRNADMALQISSRTQSHEFRGLTGTNIAFIGAHDLNRDGVLDLFLEIDPGHDLGRQLLVLDGKEITSGLSRIVNCSNSLSAKTNRMKGVCERQKATVQEMPGSLFAYDLSKGYYGQDLLQIALLVDWKIKDWSITKSGELEYTTYQPTWKNELAADANWQLKKRVSYNPQEEAFEIEYGLNQLKDVKLPAVYKRLQQ